MTLTLQRDDCTADRTFGTLLIDGVLQCQTLEPARADLDPLEDHPAIPPGLYRVSIRYSLKHHGMVPSINGVPGRTDIEIHVGNAAGHVQTDTLGCVLVGQGRSGIGLIHSRDAFNALMPILARPLAAGVPVWITIRDEPHETAQKAPPEKSTPDRSAIDSTAHATKKDGSPISLPNSEGNR